MKEKRVMSKIPYLQDRIEVVKKPIVGRCVVATEDISDFELLGAYRGNIITDEQYEEKIDKFPNCSRYGWDFHGYVLDPTDENGEIPDDTDNVLALVNEPYYENEINVLPLISRNNIWIVSIKEIKKGEELFMSYGDEYERDYETELEKTHGRFDITEEQEKKLIRLANKHKFLVDAIENFLYIGSYY